MSEVPKLYGSRYWKRYLRIFWLRRRGIDYRSLKTSNIKRRLARRSTIDAEV